MRALVSPVVAILSLACSSGGTGTVPFGTTAFATVTSAACNARVAAFSAPDPITRGNISIELVATDATSGAPIDGLAITVVPWMPAMGHGASITPSVVAKGAGVYLVTDVVLVMPGAWQLRAQLGGACSDAIVIDAQVN